MLKTYQRKWAILLLSAAVVLTGCGNPMAQDAGNLSTAEANGKGSKQQNKADQIGEVSEINGDQVTAKLVKMQLNSQGQNSASGSAKKERTFKASRGPKPTGGVNLNPSSSPKPKPSGSPGPKNQRQREYTGETKVLNLENIPVQQQVNTDQGKELKDIDRSVEKTGDLVQIFYSDDANSVIEKIVLGGGGGQKGQGGKKGNGGKGGKGSKGNTDEAL